MKIKNKKNPIKLKKLGIQLDKATSVQGAQLFHIQALKINELKDWVQDLLNGKN